ncbi:hypothetical protein AB1Y20_015578 [Prymnesium parvum]|uniref:Flavin-containing monooxygenase n=1 Tax=Prymnesium parvum TaxID=97485 RepID=A0AB34K0Z1_PRYPA
MRVAILGAGPSGLAVLKECLEAGLDAVAFEKSDQIGGVWSHGVWDSMRVNLSRANCVFSDFPWPPGADEFPTAAAVRRYLHAYARTFRLTARIFLRAAASAESSDGRWLVRPLAPSASAAAPYGLFDCLVVASGIFDQPRWPPLPGLERLPAHAVRHSQQYRTPPANPASPLPILVIGAAFSGAEIAADLAAAGKAVCLASRTPHYYLPRLLRGVPLDLAFYRYGAPPPTLAARHRALRSVGLLPNGLPPPDESKEPRVAISSAIADEWRSGCVRMCAAVERLGVEADGVAFAELADGEVVRFEQCVVASGYHSAALPRMLPHEVLQAAQYDPHDTLAPLLLPWETLHPTLRSLAFVGYYRGPFFGTIELQERSHAALQPLPPLHRTHAPAAMPTAMPYHCLTSTRPRATATTTIRARLVAALFSGEVPWPPPSQLAQLLGEASAVREGSRSSGRRQFPQDYPTHAAALSAALGVAPPAGEWPLIPALFRLRDVAWARRARRRVPFAAVRVAVARLLVLEAQLSRRPVAAGGGARFALWWCSRWVVRAAAWAFGQLASARILD